MGEKVEIAAAVCVHLCRWMCGCGAYTAHVMSSPWFCKEPVETAEDALRSSKCLNVPVCACQTRCGCAHYFLQKALVYPLLIPRQLLVLFTFLSLFCCWWKCIRRGNGQRHHLHHRPRAGGREQHIHAPRRVDDIPHYRFGVCFVEVIFEVFCY